MAAGVRALPYAPIRAQDFGADLLAGLTVGLVALPLAMAFGIASGVTPQAGLYTAIVAGGLISALGGSRMQIGGPTGAFVVIVAGIVAKFGVAGLALVTMMAGAMLVLMGLTGLGAAVRFIPRPVTIGFTNGIALLIASTQIKDFLGLRTGDVPERVPSAHGGPRFAHADRSPGRLSAVSHGYARDRSPAAASHQANSRLDCGDAGLHGFGRVRWAFPSKPSGANSAEFPRASPSFPSRRSGWTRCGRCFLRPLTVALLAAVESLLSAVVADSMSGTRHNSNVELVAQGHRQSRFAAVRRHSRHRRDCAHGDEYPRGRPNARCRHRSTRVTLLIILMVAAPLARFVPLATLSAVLFVVAYNMGEWREIGTILRLSKADIAVWARHILR